MEICPQYIIFKKKQNFKNRHTFGMFIQSTYSPHPTSCVSISISNTDEQEKCTQNCWPKLLPLGEERPFFLVISVTDFIYIKQFHSNRGRCFLKEKKENHS